MTIEQFWQNFLRETGRRSDTRYIESFSFEMTEYWANELLRLVLIGQKKATSSSLRAYQAEGRPLPKAGDMSIVTDWAGNPHCVIQTTAVTLLPFGEMTFDICRREGEDQCLETWRAGHKKFFSEECKQLGMTFTEDWPVVFEDFEMIYAAKDCGCKESK